VGAGILTVSQIYPFVLGANVGTTMTAIVAALVLASAGEPGSAEALRGVAAVKVALAHLFFNLYGIALFLPIRRLRQIPIRLAERLGDLAVKNRVYALGYLATVFFAIPLITIVGTRNLEFTYDPPKPDRLEQGPALDPDASSEPTSRRLPPATGDGSAAPVSLAEALDTRKD